MLRQGFRLFHVGKRQGVFNALKKTTTPFPNKTTVT